ncbi:MAG TPA: DPP IV N-terminal domain-containing protein, partial [Armatimonadota bacterium]|nr:DPP IV N-terminal domain-containing protein [Armatimonadota bacterium]
MRISLERLFGDPPITGHGSTEVEWHPDGQRLTYLQETDREGICNLWAYVLETGEEELLVEGASLSPPDAEPGDEEAKPIPLGGYQWYPDGKRLLLTHGRRVWTYSLEDGALTLLLRDVDKQVPPHFSPSGERLGFIRANNLWVRDLATGEERALTTDGSETVLNGKLDWVYWEELGNRKGWRSFEWSPDGEKIAFLRLDQSAVPEYPLVDVMEVHPRLTRQRYPKAGDPNSTPSVHIISVLSGLFLASEAEPDDAAYIAPNFAWMPDSAAVACTRLTRDQKSLSLRLLAAPLEARADRDTARRCLLEEADPHWINLSGGPWFLPRGEGFLWVTTNSSGYAHLYRHAPDGARIAALTEGPWGVERVHGLTETHVYFTGTGADPRERHLYRTALASPSVEQLTPAGGVHRTEWREDGKWALVTSATPEGPAHSWLLRDTGQVHATVRSPDPGWSDYDWAEAEFIDVPAADGTILHGRLLRPPHFDPASRYPVVVHVYGGPHAQMVRKTWAGDDQLEQLLAQAGILVWRLDNRGSWGRGHAFETPVDWQLGTLELADQLEGVECLKRLPYVDGDRIGITGWSYGGYLTLYALTKAPGVWRCGVAGAPVTDWKLYDSIYTERYMGTPEENPEGYTAGSVLQAAGELQAPLLLAHGTDDDNVHLQNTLQFVEALSQHRKPYELLLQPRQKHGFKGAAARIYLHERMVEFFV